MIEYKPGTPLFVTSGMEHALRQANPATGYRADRILAAALLRQARTMGVYPETLAYILAIRSERRRWLSDTQRDWAARISRRPARAARRPFGQPDDRTRWTTREAYVRCANSND